MFLFLRMQKYEFFRTQGVYFWAVFWGVELHVLRIKIHFSPKSSKLLRKKCPCYAKKSPKNTFYEHKNLKK